MGISSFRCVFLGCNPQWLYDLLPNGAMGYHPYDATHVITQLEILLFSALAFTLLNLWGKYPPELPSVNLDVDWIYRKLGRGFLGLGAIFWNGTNNLAHGLLVSGLTAKVCIFAKSAQVNSAEFFCNLLKVFGVSGSLGVKNDQIMKRRVRLGIYPIGLTALFILLIILSFLFAFATKRVLN